MLSLEETEVELKKMIDALPKEIFKDLNGGILLKEESKLSPKRLADDLYVLGEYHHDKIFGRYISIYYGSFLQVYRYLSKDRFLAELERVLKHELTHHLENMAKERDLEIEDEHDLLHYYEGHARRNKE